MVERKTRPAPLTLVARKPARPVHRSGPATRLGSASKLFVLDTNVLMHDPTSLYRFEEHDVYVPIATLEELDMHKKGMTEVSRNARQASRFIDEIVSTLDNIEDGVPLAPHSHNAASGRLFLQTQAISGDIPMSLPTSKVDNQILSTTPSARSSWCRKTSTCASRRVRWACRPRTTSTTRCWKIPIFFIPAHASSLRISGTGTARTSSHGRRRDTPCIA